MKRRRALVGVVVVVLALAGLGASLLWPAPTLDVADLDAALPTERDLPGFIAFDGLTGALSVPPDNAEGRVVLAGAELDEQCRTWRNERDDWACQDLRGVGMVSLELAENVFFRVHSTALAYEDEDAAEAAWDGLAANIRDDVLDIPNAEEQPSDVGDAAVSFAAPGVTALAIRAETVVVEAIVWDGSDQVSEEDERDMVEKWLALQISKIEELLG